ncbi:hypothetical protein TWF694_006472 [Orbilia ellipsospora]|uniref:F-box domain-containing protein n=1 Tax=Orbilia ellipsospora TaxID=2528407 RepID=A0AAV9XKL6_9PEZI
MESLPTELIRRIASLTPYPTIFSLSLVSHRLRLAVHDWQVYKAVIDNRIHQTVISDEPSAKNVSQVLDSLGIDVDKWARNPINSSLPTDLCAKYAYADYKCFTLLEKSFGADTDTKVLEDFARWGGVMASRGHPIIHLLGHTDIRHSFSIVPPAATATDVYIREFSLACYCMSGNRSQLHCDEGDPPNHYSNLSDLQPVSPLVHEILIRTWLKLQEKLWTHHHKRIFLMADVASRNQARRANYRTLQIEGTTLPRTKEAIDASYAISSNQSSNYTSEKLWSAINLHIFYVQVAGFLAYHYNKFITSPNRRFTGASDYFLGVDDGEPQDDEDYDPRQIKQTPSGFEIPFESFMKLPEPFGDPADFVWCHLEIMTSKEFLEDGEWMGFYTYREYNRFDPAMFGLKFKVVEPGEYEISRDDCTDDYDPNEWKTIDTENAEVVHITAAGEDGVGEFKLFGQILRNTGKFVFTKIYVRDHDGGKQKGPKWDWLGFMTPFGMVGMWGVHEAYCELWIWKESWYGDSDEKELANQLSNTL